MRIFGLSRGLVLDVGCGPFLTTPAPQGVIVGVDLNSRYVASYSGDIEDVDPGIVTHPPAGRTRLAFAGTAESLPFDNATFDESRCCGLLHHLTEQAALAAIREMARCTRPEGRLVIVDNVWPRHAYRRPIAWLTRRVDRGRSIRHEDELLALATAAYDGSWCHRRFTYSLTGLEAIVLEARK